MKRVSSIAILSVIMPLAAFGYDYTITGDDFINLRSHSYSVEEITQNVYNTARSQNMNAPVFQTVENNETKYYKWIAPDLTQYKTVNNSDVFALTDQGNGYVDFLAVDENGNVSTQNYYYNQPVNEGGVTTENTGVTDSIIGDFFGTYSSIDSGYAARSVSNSGTINSVAGNFIHNGSRDVSGNSGLLNATNGVIENVFADFIQNTTCAISNYGNIENIVGDFIKNDYVWDVAVISNSGSVGNIIGNFISNGGSDVGNGAGAISNSGTISSIIGSFLNNYITHGAGAILNSGTIDSITGNFLNNIGNYDYAQGGAVFNDGTITFVNDVLFSGNGANFYGEYWNQEGFYNNSGAIYNSSRGTINMNINGESSIRFATQSDGIYNAGTITANGSTIGTPGHLYLQSVDGNGTFSLNNIYAELASGQTIRQQNFNIDENSTLFVNSGGLNIDNLQNDGTLNLNGGSLSTMINGSGVTINNGELYSHPEYINQSFVNNGTLTFNGGELSRNISDYGNVTINRLTANADYLDQVVLNNGTLTLTGGTLLTDMPASWTGYTRVWDESLLDYTEVYTTLQNNGNIVIAGNVASNANIAQSTTINAGGNLVISAEKIQTNSLNNNGTLTLTGGTLSTNMSAPYTSYDNIYDENLGYYTDVYTTHNNGNIVIDGDVVSNANIAQNITINENKTLTTSADNMGRYLNDYGSYYDSYYNSYCSYADITLTNNGSLNLTGGTFNVNNISGDGNIMIDGDVISNVNMAQNTIINENASLTVSVDNIKDTNLINYGTLWFSGTGTLDKALSNYGNAGNAGGTLTANADYIDRSFTNSGTLRLTDGTLSGQTDGYGSMIIDGNVVSNANIAQSYININADGNLVISAEKIQAYSLGNEGTLTLTGGTLSTNLSAPYTSYDWNYDENTGSYTEVYTTHNNGNIVIDGDVVSNAYIAQNITINENKTLTTSADNIGNVHISDPYWVYSYQEVSSDMALVNNGTLRLTDGTFSIANLTGDGDIVIDGNVISNVNMQNTTINDNGVLTVAAGFIKNISITNNGSLFFAGEGTLEQSLSNYGGTTGNVGRLMTNADYIDQNFTNDGTLILTGGTLSTEIPMIDPTWTRTASYYDMNTGSYIDYNYTPGIMIIDGDVVADANILQETTINSGRTLTASADNVRLNVLNNNGTLKLTGGTLEEGVSNPSHYIYSRGNIVIDGDVVSNVMFGQNRARVNMTINPEKSLTTNASNISYSSDLTFVNNGTLKLTGGTFSVNNISGDGNIVIDGEVGYFNMNNGASTNQHFVVNNNKVLTFAGNILPSSMLTNNGTVVFDGYETLSENISNYGNVVIKYLDTDADFLDADVINEGELCLTGGTLSHLVSGNGMLQIEGNVAANTRIVQDIEIGDYNNSTLTISADNIAASKVHNWGTLKLTGGTLNVDLPESGTFTYNDGYEVHEFHEDYNGKVIIDGDVVANALIEQDTTINSGKSLTTSVDNIKNAHLTNNGTLWFSEGTLDKTISSYGNAGNSGVLYANANHIDQEMVNNGTLNLTQGVLRSEITGSGNVFIRGNVTNNVDFNNVVQIANGAKFTTNADLLLNESAINNNGTLNITAGILKNNVNGGKTIVGNSAILQSLNVADVDMNGTWNIGSNTVHASNAKINGQVNVDINGVSADSNEYVGGKLIANNITLDNNSELRFVVSANDLERGQSTGDLSVIESDTWTGNWHNISQANNKYDFTFDDVAHTVKFTYARTAEDIINEVGGSQNAVAVGNAWDTEAMLTDEFIDRVIQRIVERLNYAIQYNIEEYLRLLNNIAPTDTNVVSGTATSVINAISNQISDRLSHFGRNGGDMMEGVAVWGQGLFNHSAQSGDAEFTGNTFGFSLGADKKINDTTVLGLGYALNNTSATSGQRDITSTGHTLFLYGEYRPMIMYKESEDASDADVKYTQSPFHIDGTMAYGMAGYSEENAVDGISSEYDTTTISLNGNVGYNITDTIDLFVGGRYMKVSQDDYTDNLGQRISVKDDDIITARFGGKYVGNYELLVPTAHLELSYDVKSSDRLAVVNTANSSYQITGKAINSFGVQTGFGFMMNVDNWKLSLNYDLDWHPDFISHTGRIKAKYAF